MVIYQAGKHFPSIENEINPFFIVAIPGSLCEVALCLRYIPKEQPVYIIANGLENGSLIGYVIIYDVKGLLRYYELCPMEM